VDISDYSSRVGLSGQSSASSEVEVKVQKVDKVPGGCLHFAISLVPEAHPLAEDRVATIVLLSGLDLPVPDSVVDKLSGQIQNVYFVIERGSAELLRSPKLIVKGGLNLRIKLVLKHFREARLLWLSLIRKTA